MKQPNAGIYIHVPFCVSKCAYCDFYSLAETALPPEAYRRYLSALLNEMRYYHEAIIKNTPIDTVYLGGGTPTALPAPFLRELLAQTKQFALTATAEVTAEANPGTLTLPKLQTLSAGGVNRLSIGLQAWQDSLLQSLGRIHTVSDFIENFQAARDAGFNNISVDLMFALPGQTLHDWRESLTRTVDLSPEHISLYSLTPEEGTPLWQQIQAKTITLPSDETDREMYEMGRRFLTEQGYIHYELSNFAKAGYESRHNTRYWKRARYYGFGPGAHSFDGTARYSNPSDLARYTGEAFSQAAADDRQSISQAEAMAETMFLGLRLLEGVSASAFQHHFSLTPEAVYGTAIQKLIQQGLLRRAGDQYQLTRRGLDLANQVFAAFL